MVLISACALVLPAGARAQAPAGGGTTGPGAALSAAFRPERLGSATAVGLSLRVDPPASAQPLALSAVEVGYPQELGLATSGLGLEDCEPALLELYGAAACPANSKMGQGSALVEVQFGSERVSEHLALEIYDAPSTNGEVLLEILATGEEPVQASAVLKAGIQPGLLSIAVPLLASVPGAPDAALVEMQATIGGPLTYFKHVGGHTIAYRPRGVGLPDSCPRGGWRFDARLSFADGQRSEAQTTVPCPRRQQPGTSAGG